MRFMKARQWMVAAANVLALAILFGSSQVAWLRATPARPQGQPVEPDSIALTTRLGDYQYDMENDQTLLVTATFKGSAYLVKDDHTALAGATVDFRLPKYNISGTMTPKSPGEYAYSIREQIRVHAPVKLLDTKGWQVQNLRIEEDGQDQTARVAQDKGTASAFNFHRKDLKGAGLDVFETARSYSIHNHLKLAFRIVKPDGKPAANLTATVDLPQRGYTETFTTDADGWVRIDRDDVIQLSIRGGEMVHVDGPIFIEPPEDPDTLFWWEDPTPRCEMVLRSEQSRLTTKPGATAQFGFEVVNKGNRPDNFHLKVDGVPASWVEVEYGGEVQLFPFFGQVIYVNVTPERSPDIKMGTRSITATVTEDCGGSPLTASADLKVQEFHQPALAIYDNQSTATTEAQIAPDLQRQMTETYAGTGLTVIVRANGPLPPTARDDIAMLGGKVRQELGIINGLSVQIPAGKVADLARLGWVNRVDRNKPVKALLDKSVPAIGAPDLWLMGYDGTGITVAVVDTGVDYHHPALEGHVILGPDFAAGDDDPMDVYGHGTHVSGIIASQDPVYRGVAPGATIMAVRVLGDDGSGSDESVIAGVDWAVAHGANVINLSLGGPGAGGSDPLAEAVDNAVKSGVVVVVAAGNSGPDFNTVGSPGDARLAITVGAADNDRNLADWSSRGPTLDHRPKPDVVAPGVNITSSVPDGKWDTWSGTSMATPHVAGIAALLLQATHAEPLLIKQGLMATADDLGIGPNSSGAGFVNPVKALDYVRKAGVVVQQEIYPGGQAAYNFTVRNLGNVDDRFRITQWFDDNGLKYKAQSTLPGKALRSYASDRIASGATGNARAVVSIPADWAGMEDTIYLFHLQATSLADRSAVSEDRATLKVKATKRSMAEYIRTEIADLRTDIATMEMSEGTRADLLTRTNRLADQEKQAVDALAVKDEAGGDQALDASLARARELAQAVQAKCAAGLISQDDCDALIVRIHAIEEHLTTDRATAMP